MAHAKGSNTVSLTTAQALVKFLSVQFSERDGGGAPADSRHLRNFWPWQCCGIGPSSI